jgi:AraC-like DNA-binding protein
MQIAPSKELMPYIRHFLFLESFEQENKQLRLFADGNTALVLSSYQNLFSNDTNVSLPGSFFYGQVSGFKNINAIGKMSLVIVVFQPYGIKQLFGIPAKEMRDKIIGIEEILGSQRRFFQELLFGQPDVKRRVDILNKLFIELLTKNKKYNTIYLQAALEFIETHKGNLSIKQLEKYTGYTERHMERMFDDCIGLSPKKISNITRLHYFLKLLNRNSGNENLTSYSYEAGYADQSHLIKEFKKNTGLTPTEYLNTTKKLATNFLEIK